jgi:hypothetical protein
MTLQDRRLVVDIDRRRSGARPTYSAVGRYLTSDALYSSKTLNRLHRELGLASVGPMGMRVEHKPACCDSDKAALEHFPVDASAKQTDGGHYYHFQSPSIDYAAYIAAIMRRNATRLPANGNATSSAIFQLSCRSMSRMLRSPLHQHGDANRTRALFIRPRPILGHRPCLSGESVITTT